jgi:hypothetical protein
MDGCLSLSGCRAGKEAFSREFRRVATWRVALGVVLERVF